MNVMAKTDRFSLVTIYRRVNMTESLKNAQINNGISDLRLTENDLIVEETKHKAQMSTVLMIDTSHSMILYGEDRITPAKKVAMALVELIHQKIPKGLYRYYCVWKRSMAHKSERPSLFKSRSLPHQYGGRTGIGNGHSASKTTYKQTDFYDYGW